MQLMVNTLNKAQQQSAAKESEMATSVQKRSSSLSQLPTSDASAAEPPKVRLEIIQETNSSLLGLPWGSHGMKYFATSFS